MKIDHNTRVKTLKDNKFEVELIHWRYKKNDPSNELFLVVEFEDGKEIDERGGYSKATIKTPEGKKYTATAECAKADNFSLKRAHQILFGRIGKQIEKDKQNSNYLHPMLEQTRDKVFKEQCLKEQRAGGILHK